MKYAVPVIEKGSFIHFFKRARRIFVLEVEAFDNARAIAIAENIVEMACTDGRLDTNSIYEIHQPQELLKWPTFAEVMAEIEERTGLDA
jgi:hypothetical protein